MSGTCPEKLEEALPQSSSLCKGIAEGKAKRIAYLYALVVTSKQCKEASAIRDALNISA